MDEQKTPEPQQTSQNSDLGQPDVAPAGQPVEDQNSSSLESQPTSAPSSDAGASDETQSPPAAAIPGEEPAQEEPASPVPSGDRKKVLLVEDDNNLANVYTTRLEAENFNIKRVPNGEDALAAALEYKPDLILLDVMMPKVSGFDVLDILRNTPETANVKIVMLTALGQEADQQRAKDLGVDDYLVKSQVVIADVVEKIKFHLGM